MLRPLTPYGATKAAAEMLLGSYANCYGITGAALRFSNVYGPGMGEKDSFIPRLMRAARDGEGVQVRGDGSMLRDVVHVDDVVQGILTAWRGRHNGPLILGSGTSVTVNEMVTTARKVTGAPIPAENVPVGNGEMPPWCSDISAATALGYRPAYDLEAGMATVWPDFDPNGGARMIYKDPRDQVVDDAAIKALTDAYGERVTSLPPVAIVIAAYNEEGAIGPVIDALPASICGLATATIVVVDGSVDSTAKRRPRRRARLRRAGQPWPGSGAPARLPDRPRRRRHLHRDHRRGRPVQPGRDGDRAGARGGGRGGLRDRIEDARQRGDQGHDPARRGQVLRRDDQPADRAAGYRSVVRPAGHARRGHRRRPARPAAVPGVRAADRRHHPRLQGGRGARDHPPAAGR